MTSALQQADELNRRIRRLGSKNSFVIRDAKTGISKLSAALVNLTNSRLGVYAISQGLTTVSNRGRLVYRGETNVISILMSVVFTLGVQDSYEGINLRWPDFDGDINEKNFTSGYFPNDYTNAIIYCQELFDEAIVLPSPTFTEFLRSGRRYYLDIENNVQDREKS